MVRTHNRQTCALQLAFGKVARRHDCLESGKLARQQGAQPSKNIAAYLNSDAIFESPNPWTCRPLPVARVSEISRSRAQQFRQQQALPLRSSIINARLIVA
jgi:hypothetical protein